MQIKTTLSLNYVRHWGFEQALKELFQNTLDEENKNKNGYNIFYKDAKKEVHLINKNTNLDVSTLFMGETSKSNDSNVIGNFGEGYKVAALVLLREGKTLTIENGMSNTVWTAEKTTSSIADVEILAFSIEEKQLKHNNLVFIVSDVSKEEYKNTIDIYLVKKSEEKIRTGKRTILLESKSKIYTNGLLATVATDLVYGYDLPADCFVFNRDREALSHFEIEFEAAKTWRLAVNSNLANYEKFYQLLKDDATDIKKLQVSELNMNIKTKIAENFISAYGYNAVPVSSQEEAEILAKGKAVIVSDKHKEVLMSSGLFSFQLKEITIQQQLMEWLTAHQNSGCCGAPLYEMSQLAELIRRVEN